MLSKLLKYDLKWIYKVIVIFYILSIVFSVIGRGLTSIENSVVFQVIGQISLGIAIAMMINSLINCLMRAWVRFIRNVYKDESYLTHTLPVHKRTIYLSKILSAIICTFTTAVVILICIAICYYSPENIEMLKSGLELAALTYDITVIELAFMITTILFLEIVFIIFIGYVGIILGHKSNSNKMVKSIVISFALYALSQTLTLIFIVIAGLFSPQVMNLINTTEMIDVNTIKTIMYMGMGIYTTYIIIYYIIGKKQFEKGVNVD